MAVQPRLRADVQLILGLVADFGAHAGLGDEVQTLAVTSVITSWGRGATGCLSEVGVSSSPNRPSALPQFPPHSESFARPPCRSQNVRDLVSPHPKLRPVGVRRPSSPSPDYRSHLDASRAAKSLCVREILAFPSQTRLPHTVFSPHMYRLRVPSHPQLRLKFAACSQLPFYASFQLSSESHTRTRPKHCSAQCPERSF